MTKALVMFISNYWRFFCKFSYFSLLACTVFNWGLEWPSKITYTAI